MQRHTQRASYCHACTGTRRSTIVHSHYTVQDCIFIIIAVEKIRSNYLLVVYCAVPPHHLLFSLIALPDIDSFYKMWSRARPLQRFFPNRCLWTTPQRLAQAPLLGMYFKELRCRQCHCCLFVCDWFMMQLSCCLASIVL